MLKAIIIGLMVICYPNNPAPPARPKIAEHSLLTKVNYLKSFHIQVVPKDNSVIVNVEGDRNTLIDLTYQNIGDKYKITIEIPK